MPGKWSDVLPRDSLTTRSGGDDRNRLWHGLRTKKGGDNLNIGVLVDGVNSSVSGSIAGMLDPSKGHIYFSSVGGTVNVDDSSLKARHNCLSSGDI